MYRSVLALLFATVLLLGGCAAGQQTVPKEKRLLILRNIFIRGEQNQVLLPTGFPSMIFCFCSMGSLH